MNVATALRAAECCGAFTLPELITAQEMLEAAGYAAEALAVEEYLMDQSDEAWEAAGIKPY